MPQFIASTEIVYGDKLYTLTEHLWYKFHNDLGFTRPFKQKDGWYELLQDDNGDWWLHLFPAFQWNGANLYPDYKFMMMPSAIHDTDHWLIMHGIIPEENNNLIDKELEDSILFSKTKIPFKDGGWIPKKARARIIRRATNTANEKRNLAGQEHSITRVSI